MTCPQRFLHLFIHSPIHSLIHSFTVPSTLSVLRMKCSCTMSHSENKILHALCIWCICAWKESSFWENCLVCEPSSCVRPLCSLEMVLRRTIAKPETRNNSTTGTPMHLFTLKPKVILLIKEMSCEGLERRLKAKNIRQLLYRTRVCFPVPTHQLTASSLVHVSTCMQGVHINSHTQAHK